MEEDKRYEFYNEYEDLAVVYPDGVRMYKSIIDGDENRHENLKDALSYVKSKGYKYGSLKDVPVVESIFKENYASFQYPKALEEIRVKYGLEYVSEQQEEEENADPEMQNKTKQLDKEEKETVDKKIAIAKQEQKNLDAKMASMKTS
jgi:hypothetical protein